MAEEINNNNIRTGTLASGITATLQPLSTLFFGTQVGRANHYEKVTMKNVGTVPLLIALYSQDFTATPVTNDALEIDPSDSLVVDEITMAKVMVATTDIAGVNKLQFFGQPVFKP